MSLFSEPVNRVRDPSPRSSRNPNAQTCKECWRCGRRGHFGKDAQCLARGKTCTKCSQVGHFADVCKTRIQNIPGSSAVQYTQRVDREDDEYLFAIAGGDDGEKVSQLR